MTTRVFIQGATGRLGSAVSALAGEGDAFVIVGEVPEADVVVDFSTPEGAKAALEACLEHGVPLVTGTTGLGEGWRSARDAAAARLAILEAPNMSIGVNLTYVLLQAAAAAVGADADIDIIESHRSGKRDAPSGTALRMGEIIKAALPGDKAGSDAPVHYHSLRAGDIPGRTPCEIHPRRRADRDRTSRAQSICIRPRSPEGRRVAEVRAARPL